MPETISEPALVELLPGGAARSLLLRRGRELRLTALHARANVSCLLLCAGSPVERLCVPDTLKAQRRVAVAPPMVLMSDMGRALASVTGSSLAWHDAICGTSLDADLAAGTYQRDGNGWRRSGREGHLRELRKQGLGERDLHAPVNFFSKAVPADDAAGTLSFVPGHAAAGDRVALRFEVDCLVVLSAAPHPLDDEWGPADVELAIGQSAPAGPDDPCRRCSPESARALDETARSLA